MIEYIAKFSIKAKCDRCGSMSESPTQIRNDDPNQGSNFVLTTLPMNGWTVGPNESKDGLSCICPHCKGKI